MIDYLPLYNAYYPGADSYVGYNAEPLQSFSANTDILVGSIYAGYSGYPGSYNGWRWPGYTSRAHNTDVVIDWLSYRVAFGVESALPAYDKFITAAFSAESALLAYAAQESALSAESALLAYAAQESALSAESALKAYASQRSGFGVESALKAYVNWVASALMQSAVSAYQVNTSVFSAQAAITVYSVNQGAFNQQSTLPAYVDQLGGFVAESRLAAYTASIASFDTQAALDAVEMFYGWALNLTTGAISKYDAYNFTSLSGALGADANGIYELYGASDNGAVINAFVESGKLDFGQSALKRVSDAYLGVNGGKLALTVSTENSVVNYSLRATRQLETVKANLARGAKGRYWQVKLANVAGSTAKIDDIELVVNTLSRKV